MEAAGVLTFSPPVSRRRREALKEEAVADVAEDRAASVNRSLVCLGLHPVDVSHPESLLEALQALLLSQSGSFASHAQENTQLERIGRLEAEKDVLQQRAKQLAIAMDAAEREFSQKEEKLRSSLTRSAQQVRALEAEKAELSKEIAVLQHRDNQYVHEVRKKERELEKMQKKLQTALAERGVKDTRGIDLHGAPRASGASSKNALSEADVQKRVIRSLEERVAALAAENDGLRVALQELTEHAAQQPQPTVREDSAADAIAVPQIALLPLDGAEGVQHLRAQVWQRIEQLKANLSALEASEGEVALSSLQQQVNELRRIIVEQERLLHFSLDAADSRASPAAAREAEAWASPVLRQANGSASSTPARSAEKRPAALRPRRLEQQENRPVAGLRV